jgi:hypothetical protein
LEVAVSVVVAPQFREVTAYSFTHLPTGADIELVGQLIYKRIDSGSVLQEV